MKIPLRIGSAAAVVALLSSCVSYTTVRKTSEHPDAPGMRYSLPRIFIIGRPSKDGTVLFERFLMEDPDNEYAVQTTTIFGKHTTSLTHDPTTPGLIGKFETKQYADALAEKGIGAVGDILKTKAATEATEDKDRETKIAAAESVIRQKETALAKAKIQGEEKGIQLAEEDLRAAQRELGVVKAGNIPGGTAGATVSPAAFTPVVYEVMDDGNGNVGLRAMQYKTFVRLSQAKGEGDGWKLVSEGTQMSVASSRKLQPPKDPPAVAPAPVMGQSTTRIELDQTGKPLDKEIEITFDEEIREVMLISVIQTEPEDPAAATLLEPVELSANKWPDVALKNSKTGLLRFKTIPKGKYRFTVTYTSKKGDVFSGFLYFTLR